jgi:hypothetical protein
MEDHVRHRIQEELHELPDPVILSPEGTYSEITYQ